MRDGDDALLLTTGVGLAGCLAAAERLAGSGLRTAVLHLPTIKPLDVEAILAAVERVPVAVSVEETPLMGGLGSAIAEALCETNLLGERRFKRIGIPDVFPDKYGRSERVDEDATAFPPTMSFCKCRRAARFAANARTRDTNQGGVKETGMGKLLNIVNPLHRKTERDYIVDGGRQVECMRIARQYEEDYWDVRGGTAMVATATMVAGRSSRNSLLMSIICRQRSHSSTSLRQGLLALRIHPSAAELRRFGLDISAHALRNREGGGAAIPSQARCQGAACHSAKVNSIWPIPLPRWHIWRFRI